METLRTLVFGIDTKKSNLNGSRDSFDNLNLHDIYKLAEPKIEEMCLKYNISNFSLPTTRGYNSLVFFADSTIENHTYKLAVKICVISKKDVDTLDSIYMLASDNEISPKIYYDYTIDYGSQNFVVKINVSERVISFSDFEWTSIEQMKKSILTLIEKTTELHSLGFVHNDIKYENLGLDSDGNIYLFDFDNFTEITRKSCSKRYSSNVCHPPDNLISASISHGLGNRIIDLFSICTIILGEIIGINSWQFDNEQLCDKRYQITHFKRHKVYDVIQKRMFRIFKDLCISQFWYSLINFFHIVFQKNQKITTKRAFVRRTKKLIMRMKTDLE
jgi:predicted Ser/Thr protein kinase